MHPAGVASAVWVFAAAPSKLPFYVAGGLAAGWAVLLSAYGITHPEFPGSQARARVVMAISAVLVVGAMTTAVVTAGEEGAAEGEATGAPSAAVGGGIDLAADASGAPAFDRKELLVRAGRVRVRFENPSPVPHNVAVAKGPKVVGKTRTIESATATAEVTLAAGEYDFYCAVDAHRQAGMEGRLTVR